MSRHRFDDEQFEIAGERPYYIQSATLPKFHLNDGNIYVSVAGGTSRGPFKIAGVETTSTPIKYKLCFVDGTLVDGGELFEETRLIQQN